MSIIKQEQNSKPFHCGIYKNWQLTRLEKLYKKLKKPFNKEELVTMTRKELNKLLHKANSDIKSLF